MTSARSSDEHSAAAAAGHWDDLYSTRAADQLSWTQPDAGASAELIDSLPVEARERVVDVGGGTGVLVDHLLAAGRRRITVLDASQQALAIARRRVESAGHPTGAVTWVVADVRAWQPSGTFRLWHDRAVFHFLTDPADRSRYAELAAAHVDPGGHLVIGTFAADGPDRCSGLPVIRYGPDALAAQFRPAFDPVTARDEHHRTPWGTDQHFTWLVLQRRRPEPCPGTVLG
ncbi:methyltransferase family protein [Pseudonocardia sediminis]|uniref:Methyltransferase family protein n=1 Tax=Pseudonocardia sediminis TaxID=1397368 RepID=A0A4Q7UUL7_PSEST|nr:class I SAM-dependent methyltransferase [Pseudonocardia sediminis]RZT85647.1 methyltransferase family protein [Pseudonocardia sediminis]